jgi:hypothetical protein
MAIKKTKRAIAAPDVPRVERRAELFARLSGGARDEIEYHIKWYRSGASWRGQGPRIKMPPELDQMRDSAEALAKLLDRRGVDQAVAIFFKADLIDTLNELPDDQAIRDALERMRDDLAWLSNRIAAARAHGKNRGRKTDRPRHFVDLIASVIESEKGPIGRSRNRGTLADLLWEIVSGVDPDIGRGTVDEILKERSKRRRGEIHR